MPPRVETPSSAPPRSSEPERDNALSRRFCRPVHYEVEIKSVTELLKLPKYEFGVFKAGDYEWSLCLYPKGHKDHEGKVYMSMYLSIEKPDNLRDSEQVVVDYKFFVRDNNSREYVTFKEKGKELRAFSKAKPRWGLSKFLSLASFNNPANGYREGECCRFGAEVLVSKPERRKEETLTIIRDTPHYIVTTKIRQFSTSNNKPQYSDPFTLGTGRNWKLKVCPQRREDREGNSLSVYLQAHKLPRGIKMYVEAKLRVLNNNDHQNDKEKRVRGWLSAKNYNCGDSDFMSWGDLCKPQGGFVCKRELEITVQILELVTSNVASNGAKVC